MGKKALIVATVVQQHIATFHLPMIKMLKDAGWQVEVASHNDYDNPLDCEIPNCDVFHEIPFERSPFSRSNFKAYKELKELIDKGHFDIIHCHTPVGGMLTRIAARKARKDCTRVIYTAHGFHFFKNAPLKNWLLFYPVESVLSRWTDTLITINQEDFERAKKNFHAKKTLYVPGVGIDLKRFEDILTKDKKDEIRSRIKIPNDAFMLLSVGELNPNKNHEVVIRALKKLDNNNIHYVIGGKDGGTKERLLKLAEELGVTDQIHLIGYKKDILEIYKSADIFVFPSFREGLSVALMEAMASGLPCVVSKIRGNIDLVEEGRNGYLVSPSNIEEFTEKIEKLLNDSSLRQEISKNNISDVKKYSLPEIEKTMKVIYGLN